MHRIASDAIHTLASPSSYILHYYALLLVEQNPARQLQINLQLRSMEFKMYLHFGEVWALLGVES